MDTYKDRLEKEHSDLCEKIERLVGFIGGDLYTSLDPAEQTRLRTQAFVMRQYADILQERIKFSTSSFQQAGK